MYRRYVGRRMLLILPSGTVDGTLHAVDKDGLTVEHATFIAEDGQGQRPMDGTVLIPIASIEFAQVL